MEDSFSLLAVRGERVSWALASNGGCARCQAIAQVVQEACGGRGLDVVSLDDQRVRSWVGQARPGRPVPWTPILFRIGSTTVKMWTGPTLTVRLAALLGPRASIKVLHSLGAAHQPTTTPATGPTRRKFLEIGAGGLIAIGIMATRATTASADPIARWVDKNRQELPRTYDEIATLSAEYRSAIYQELSPAERSAAWVTHLTRQRQTFSILNAEQSEIFDEAMRIAEDPSNFTDSGPVPTATDGLTARSIDAFGIEAARRIFATLGPDTATVAVSCECSTLSDYCGGRCHQGSCTLRTPGCGFLYQYTCNGLCR